MSIKPTTTVEFFIWYGANSITTTLRKGQFLFNALLEFRPDLAEKMRGTAFDPFHNDAKIDAACEWINTNW